MLDIIVTHSTEKWDTVKNFFTMLALQRGIDFDAFKVILVNDGEENAFTDITFADMPFRVEQMSIPKSGVSAARNAGIRAAKAEWLMFCDCDDMFFNPYALMDILNVLPAPKVDLLWSDIFIEDKKRFRATVIQKKGLNYVFNHGKVYRRKFLLDNGIFFDENIDYCEDSLFNTTAFTIVDDKRVGHIVTQAPTYVWCDVEGSVTNMSKTQDIAPISVFHRNEKVCELYKTHRPREEYCGMVARTVIDAYHALNVLQLSGALLSMRDEFAAWFRLHEREWESVPYETVKKIKESSRKSMFPSDAKIREDISVSRWLESLKRGCA